MSRWNKSLFRTLALLSLPTMVEEILRTLLQYVDTAMVGQLGEQATAAVSVTTTITWPLSPRGWGPGTGGVGESWPSRP